MKIKIYFSLLIMFLSAHSGLAKDTTSTYLSQSKMELDSGHFKSAILLAKQSIDSKNSDENLLQDYLQIGNVFYKIRSIDSAAYYYQLASNYLTDDSKNEDRGHLLLQGAKISRRKSQYTQTLNQLKEALVIYEELKDTLKIATIRLNYGNLFNTIYKFDNAFESYHEAVAIYKTINKTQKIGSCYNNIGNAYMELKQTDSSFKYLYLTLSIRKSSTNPLHIAYCYYNIASLHKDVGNYDSAMYYIDKSIIIKETNSHPSELIGDYFIKGAIYYEDNQFNDAIKYLKKCNVLSKKYKNTRHINETHKFLGYTYFKMNNFKQSAKYFEHYVKKSDAINSENSIAELEKKLINFEFVKDSLSKKHLLLEKQNSEIEKSNLELKKDLSKTTSNYQMFAIIFMLISGSIIFYSIKKRLNEATKNKQILEQQNDELKRTLISKEEKETLLKEVHHRVKNNLQIISSLIRLQSQYTSKDNYESRINDTENRIRSMALVHEKLYKSSDLSRLNAKSYIEDLAQNILDSIPNDKNINFKITIPELNLKIDTLIPLGLIINETVSNSIKYAFPNKKNGEVCIELDEKKNILTISDNGIGTKLSYNKLSEDSLGMELIETLCEQLDGELIFNSDNGFNYQMKFDKFV